ncbi:MAG TPA: penicillin-binding protein 2 [Acidimicrobiales bacterium]|nr:penicillin-binding protein 2 [Acidimicrobiales bacterium]
MSRRSLRHPLGGGHFYPKPGGGRSRPKHRSKVRQPRIRPRRNVSVSALVASPEDQPSRPTLRLQIVGAIVLVLFVVMVLRLWSLQVIDGKSYAAAVDANQVRTVQVAPPRGLIVDRNDTILAGNKVETEIVLSRAEATQHPAAIGKVATLVTETPKQIQAALTDQQYSPYEPVPVLEDAPKTKVQYLDTHSTQFPGVSVQQVTERQYPQGSANVTSTEATLATHILGYLGAITAPFLKDHPNEGYTQSTQIGKAGIEYQYQQYLRGVPGKQELEVNAAGTVVGTLKETAPTQGDAVVLNITAGLQRAVQQALAGDIASDKQIRDPTTGLLPAATSGAIVVMNAETGAILALASYPTYDLNTWVGGISTAAFSALMAGCQGSSGACPLNDEAIQGLYAPGSTFKLATATAGLQTGLISPNSQIKDTGTFKVKGTTCTKGGPGCTFKDDTQGDTGTMNVAQALTRSDDYFFYTLGDRFYTTSAKYGPTPIQTAANAYGLGELTDIDLPGETQGRIDSAAEVKKLHQANPTAFPNTTWYIGNNVEMAFGQGGTVVTPIEEAQAYATFADHGVKMQPQVAHAVVSPQGKVIKTVAPKQMGKVTLSPANYQAMLTGFMGVVWTKTRGTAYTAFKDNAHFTEAQFPIAGKTGTADVSTGEPDAWFVGFGPTNTTHQYVVAALVHHGGYGAAAAAPAVANIYNYLYANPITTTVKLPTAAEQPSTTAPPTQPALGTPTTTTTTTIPGSTTTTAPGTTTSTSTSTSTSTTPPRTGTSTKTATPPGG